MIIFKSVKMKNFFSVGNTPIEIKLNDHGKSLIIGKNGSSKSSCILDSIVFALYGKPFRKTTIPNIINSINKCNLLVEIEFSIGDKEYKVVRGLKPAVFEIYCDGVLKRQDASKKDYQEYLEKYILKVNHKSFINIVILGSARYSPFMCMTAADRRNIIEELLDIQIFSTMNSLVKDKVSKLKDELNQVKYNIDITNEKIDLQKQNIKESKKNAKDQINVKKQEIEDAKKQITVLEENLNLNQTHIDGLKEKLVNKDEVEGYRNKSIALESKTENELKKLKKEIDFYKKNDNCPTCKQSIQEDFKTSQIELNETQQGDLNNKLALIEENIIKINKKISKFALISEHIQKHQSEIVKINTSISAIQNNIQKDLNNIEDITNSYVDIEQNNDRLNILNNELLLNEQRQNELIELKRYYDFSAVMLKDGGIKTKIIKQYLPVMNKLINTFLSKMNFFVNFNIDENFEEIIKSRHRDEFKYENFSEGEKTKIDLAILFAFRQIAKMKNSVNTNLLIMDEILDGSLDLESCDLFLGLIEHLEKTNIFIISHRGDQIADKFERVLKFEKVRNFTRMSETK